MEGLAKFRKFGGSKAKEVKEKEKQLKNELVDQDNLNDNHVQIAKDAKQLLENSVCALSLTHSIPHDKFVDETQSKKLVGRRGGDV